jgi:hypothetical protein
VLVAVYLPAFLGSIPVTELHRYYEGSDFHETHRISWFSLIPIRDLPIILSPTTRVFSESL